jgi:DNA replication licensing factor MCM2
MNVCMLISPLQDVPLEHLGDIKADSIAAWIATDSVHKAIEKHFLNFLMTYVDEHGTSVYGQRIRNLGESAYPSLRLFRSAHSVRIAQ